MSDTEQTLSGRKAARASGRGLRFAALLLAGGFVAAAMQPGAASAQSASEMDQLKAQLRTLQNRLNSMEAQQRRTPKSADARRAVQAAEDAKRDAAAAQAEAAAARQQLQQAEAKRLNTTPVVAASGPVGQTQSDIDLKGAMPGSFRIPGTNTSLRLYGFIKGSMYGDLGPRTRGDVLSAQSIPLNRAAGGGRTGGTFGATAKRSRFGVETYTPINDTFGGLRTIMEFDWAAGSSDTTQLYVMGTNGNYIPRLRLASAEFGKLQGWGTVLVGQYHSLWSDADVMGKATVQLLSDWTGLGQSFVRQPQFRYSKGFGNLTLTGSIEASYSDTTNTGGVLYPDTANSGSAGLSVDKMPDFLVRAAYVGDNYWVDGGALLRRLSNDNNAATAAASRYTRSEMGWGVRASGGVNLLDKRLVLTAQTYYGNGMGRYLDATGVGLGAVTNAGMTGVSTADIRFNTVTTLAGNVGAEYFFTPQLRTNVWMAGAKNYFPSYASGFAAASADLLNKSIWAGVVNLIYSPIPRIDVGVEWQHIQRTLNARDTNGISGGSADRIQGSVIVRF